ncbi:mCG1031252, partial [Mus musculus]
AGPFTILCVGVKKKGRIERESRRGGGEGPDRTEPGPRPPAPKPRGARGGQTMKPMKKACPGLAGSASGSKSPPATRAKALRRRGAGEGDKPEEEEEAQPQEQAGPEEAEEGEEEEAERDPGAEGTHPELQPNDPTPGLTEDPKGDGEAGRWEPSLSRKTATFKSRAPKKKYVEEHGTG